MPYPNSPRDSLRGDIPQPNGFVTDHLTLAAFLASIGHEPVLTASPSGHILFTFAAMPSLEAAVAEFSSGTAHVEPAAYDAVRIQLRKRMDALLGGVR